MKTINIVFNKFLTTEYQVVAFGVNLDDLIVTQALFQGSWIWGVDPTVQKLALPTNVRRIKNGDEEELQVQLQLKSDDGYLKCVCLRFRNNGDNTEARVEWACWQTGDHGLGYDFTNDRAKTAPIATGVGGEGFGVAALGFAVCPPKTVVVDGGADEMEFPFADGEEVYIRADNSGKFFCAESENQNGERKVICNRPSPGECEKFIVIRDPSGDVAFKSKANGLYVSVENDADRHLCAQSGVVDSRERFCVIRRAIDGHYALRSCANSKYVSADPWVGEVKAQVNNASVFDWFDIIRCNEYKDCPMSNPAAQSCGVNAETNSAGMAGTVAAAGGIACATGVTAAVFGAAVPAAVGGAGCVVGGVVGGILGAHAGIALLGTGIPATIPGMIAGASLGGHAAVGLASALGVATAPAWAVPVAIVGGVVALCAAVFGLGRWLKFW